MIADRRLPQMKPAIRLILLIATIVLTSIFVLFLFGGLPGQDQLPTQSAVCTDGYRRARTARDSAFVDYIVVSGSDDATRWYCGDERRYSRLKARADSGK